MTNIEIPKSILKALRKPKWRVAIRDEIDALKKNGTWEISDLPQGKQPIECK